LGLLWSLALVFWALNFWWFTFVFTRVTEINSGLFLFIRFYAVLLYALPAPLFPEDHDGEPGYRRLLMLNRRWFYSGLIVLLPYPSVDYVIKLEADVSIVGHAPYALFAGARPFCPQQSMLPARPVAPGRAAFYAELNP